MSRTRRRNRKPERARILIRARGHVIPRAEVPPVVPDGKQMQRLDREKTDKRRISLRKWKARVKTALRHDREPPPPPRSQGWESW